MRVLVLFSLCILAFGSCQDLTGWSLVWYDEFDGTTLNTSKWQNEVDCWGGGNGELQCYTARQENCKVSSGNLIITAVPGTYTGTASGCTNNNDNSCTNTKSFTSARIRSLYDPSGSFLHGRFEIRAILPNGKHLWPAFWMLATDNTYGTWAASGEFDILEARGEETSIVQSTLHYGGVWPNNVYTTSGKLDMGVDLSASYHIYAMEWEEYEARFYWDSNMIYSLPLNKSWCVAGASSCPYTQNGQPWDQKFHILLNMAVGGGFFNGYPALTDADVQAWTNPSFIVDYVRVYARSNNTGSTTGGSTTGSATTGESTTTGSAGTTTGTSSSSGAADNSALTNQNQGNTVNGMTEDQIKLYFYIAVGCSIGSVVILIVALSLFAVYWRKKKSETLAPIGFH